MSERSGPTGQQPAFTELELAAIGSNLTELRKWASGAQSLHWSLAIAFVVGLAAHVGGYVLRSRGVSEPFALIAELLYALGWALWTGAVVVLFVQVIPEAKRRDVQRALAVYDALPKAKQRQLRRLFEPYQASTETDDPED